MVSEPRGWTAADLLSQIDATHVDGDSSYQFRIHEITAIERLPGQQAVEDDKANSGQVAR